MNFKTSLTQWCDISLDSRILIITDKIQYEIAEFFQNELDNDCEIIQFEPSDIMTNKLKELKEDDLLIVILSFDTFIKDGANNYFSPFTTPNGIVAKYIFIRLNMSKESLLQGLSTPKSLVYNKIAERKTLNFNNVRIVNNSGTNIILKIDSFDTYSYEINNECKHAFLPPSETSARVIAGTANGKIVIDITVGQLYYYGNLLGYFGAVKTPITMIVQNGLVADIYGNDMANELKHKLFALPVECRELVELGQGLSKMEPTGLIGIDESIIDTCHFGIGDSEKCGLHLDVVISNPTLEKIN